jgi:hypothetical protein
MLSICPHLHMVFLRLDAFELGWLLSWAGWTEVLYPRSAWPIDV